MSATDKPAFAVLWFEKAAENLRTAKLTLAGGLYANACFMSHQTVEIGLKAYLFAQGEELYRTHGLPELLERCSHHDRSFRELGTEADYLDAFYLETRYLKPDEDDEGKRYNRYDAKDAVRAAERVFSFTAKRIKPLLKPPSRKKKK